MADLAEPEDLRFLSLWGLTKEAVKVLRSHAKLFVGLALSLILPVCAIGLGRSLISESIVNRITRDQLQLAYGHPDARRAEDIYKDEHRELLGWLALFLIYVLVDVAFSLLATSAIIYSVACIYSEKVTTCRRVFSVIPLVWKRLMVTFCWTTFLMFIYAVLCAVAIIIVGVLCALIFHGNYLAVSLVVWAGAIGFAGGAIYLGCVWHLANVVTVLEEGSGWGAIKQGLRLIKGKQLVAVGLLLILSTCALLVGLASAMWVQHPGSLRLSLPLRVLLGCCLMLMLTFWDLMDLIMQTILYFACKAYHHESIDRLQLSQHLGAYRGEYLPLRTGSIEL